VFIATTCKNFLSFFAKKLDQKADFWLEFSFLVELFRKKFFCKKLKKSLAKSFFSCQSIYIKMNLVKGLTKTVSKTVSPLAKAATRTSKGLLDNTYVSAVLTLFLILYASLARPQLPNFMLNLFDNPLFRMLFLFGLAFMASRNVQVALLVAVAFTVTMNLLSEQKMVDGFLDHQQLKANK